mgnify:CR=1 FL=1
MQADAAAVDGQAHATLATVCPVQTYGPLLSAHGGDASRLFVSYKKIAESVSVGSKVLLDDGEIILEVSKVAGDAVHCVADAEADRQRRGGRQAGRR